MNEKDLTTLVEVSGRAESNTRAIAELKKEIKEIRQDNKAIYTIATSVELIAKDMQNLKADVTDMKGKYDGLMERMDVEITGVRADVRKVDDKGKWDWMEFVKHTLIPMIISAGIGALVIGLVK